VIWYDFIFDNPRNPDVRGIPLGRIKQLFPEASIKTWRVTLAPPISRVVTRLHPACYAVFCAVRPFRTHLLCWIRKR